MLKYRAVGSGEEYMSELAAILDNFVAKVVTEKTQVPAVTQQKAEHHKY